jgi:hypothetical protein
MRKEGENMQRLKVKTQIQKLVWKSREWGVMFSIKARDSNGQ